LLGGARAFVKPGESLVFKPNWLAAATPEEAVTTHPEVFRAVATEFLAAGAQITYGDSPAFQAPEVVARKTGFTAVGDALGLKLADFVTPVEIVYDQGLQNKKFVVAKAVAQADGVVSLPKLKTHGFLKFTGSIKNQFGCVPGALKGEYHVKLPDARDFARMLVDLNCWVAPRLYVMDGIVAMEGNGPRGGTPRPMHLLAFSSDPVALDASLCRLLDVNPELVPTTAYAAQVGAGTLRESEIELLGDPFASFSQPQFDIKRDPLPTYRQSGLFRAASNALVPKPFIVEAKCTRCGTCVKVCPVTPKAVDWHSGDKKAPPSYVYDRCIRCYCCQELCPEKAVELKVPLLRRLLDGPAGRRA
jgi:uncharacterized protein (DUF362 family)/Pyruvate/2-oxoacid:ferredoxin oxidoreductase delta subunit